MFIFITFEDCVQYGLVYYLGICLLKLAAHTLPSRWFDLVCCARCNFNLPSVEAEEEAHGKMPPIKVKFEIPYFTVSGVQVGVLSENGLNMLL